jgi:hypothetical protein
VTSCVEGAIELIDGKARLVREEHCDGLGACVGDCPKGAISLVDREEAAHPPAPPVNARQAPQPQPVVHACPGSRVVHRVQRAPAAPPQSAAQSELTQWPVQLHLVPPNAPYFQGTDLLLAADCAAFSLADFHSRFLRGRALAIACPKLDDPSGYIEKLTAMMGEGGVRSVTVVTMEVPCCRGLERLAMMARQAAGSAIPLRRVVVGIDGGILVDQPIE